MQWSTSHVHVRRFSRPRRSWRGSPEIGEQDPCPFLHVMFSTTVIKPGEFVNCQWMVIKPGEFVNEAILVWQHPWTAWMIDAFMYWNPVYWQGRVVIGESMPGSRMVVSCSWVWTKSESSNHRRKPVPSESQRTPEKPLQSSAKPLVTVLARKQYVW